MITPVYKPKALCKGLGPLLPTWTNHNPNVDTQLYMKLFIHSQSSTVQRMDNFMPHFTVHVITYACLN